MMKRTVISSLIICTGLLTAGAEEVQSIFNFTVEDIDGKRVSLENFRGKIIMIVNVASRCGYTPQYKGLQAIYEKYRERGLVVLGFPANNFLGQEPGMDAEIKDFCTINYGVTFPMFSKISVKGRDIHPLYAYLTDKKISPGFGGPITWNFNKFLVDREGRIIARFKSGQDPESPTVIEALEKALG